MADKILIKRSAVPAKVPTDAQLAAGELAINTADGRLYLKKDNGTVMHLGDRATHTGVQPISSVTDLQAALDGKQPVGNYVVDTDPRLSDSREWTADIVTQAEAEEGTATTPLKWTAQRVRQSFDAAWATAKAVLLDTINVWTKPQVIRQGIANSALGLHMPTSSNVAIEFGTSTSSESPLLTFFGVRGDGVLATGPNVTLQYGVHTAQTLPVRSASNVLNYTGNGVTRAEDERAALELGAPTISANTNIFPGRNRNIMVSGNRILAAITTHYGKGVFASMTIRSNNTSSRTITLGSTIINTADYDASYVVTNTQALYLEGRYIEQGFVITYLTMIPILPAT